MEPKRQEASKEVVSELKTPNVFYSLAEAALYCKTTRQAVFIAIQKQELKAEKKRFISANGSYVVRWVIKAADLDAYRAKKYNPDRRRYNNELIYSLDEDRWSILHASKFLSQELRRPFPVYNLYYLLRKGEIKGSRKGSSWVLSKSDVLVLLDKLKEKDEIMFRKYQKEQKKPKVSTLNLGLYKLDLAD